MCFSKVIGELSVMAETCVMVSLITVTIYFINPSGKLKLSFDRTTKNIIILNHKPHAHTHI